MVPSAKQANYVEQPAETIRSELSECQQRGDDIHHVSMLDFQRRGDSAQDAIRIQLRKRSVSDERQGVVLSSYNSDFLSGIFADIAQANSSSAQEDPDHSDPRLDNAMSVKKSRVDLHRSISRCAKSYANLASQDKSKADLFDGPASKALVTKAAQDRESYHKTQEPSRPASLSYPLHCVSSASSNEDEDLGKLAFPHLPATVSDYSCGTSLSRNSSGQQLPVSDTAPAVKENNSYGWFVEMEDEEQAPETHIDAYQATTGGLAFQAPTAPKAVNHDAEVEWAKAADTVDDVLGVFF
jgi:hypothetical protein